MVKLQKAPPGFTKKSRKEAWKMIFLNLDLWLLIGDLGSAIQGLYNSTYIILLLLWSYFAGQHETKRGQEIFQNILQYWQIHVAAEKKWSHGISILDDIQWYLQSFEGVWRVSRWWQLKYFWNFHPDPWGNVHPMWLAHIFQMVGKKPPTRYVL